MPTSTSAEAPVPAWAALLPIILAAAVLRLGSLDAQSLWYDEAATWAQVNGSFGDIFSRTAADNYPPLYNVLAWVSMRLFGDAEWALRLPAALLGIANIPLIYLVGARIAGPTAGLVAAILLAFSGFHVWYSQEARMYALLAFAATAFAWSTLRLVAAPRWTHAVLAAVAGAVLLYSHPYGAFTWLGIGLGTLWVLLRRRDGSAILLLIAVGAASALAFLPWALILAGRAEAIDAAGFWIAPPTVMSVRLDVDRLTGGVLYLVLIALLMLVLFRRRLAPLRLSGAVGMLILWALVPIALGLAASAVFEPIFHRRYLIGTLPAWHLMFAAALMMLAQSARARIIALSATILIGLVTLLVDAPRPRDDWRGMADAANLRLQPGDCLAVVQSWHRVALDYYFRDPNLCTIPGSATPDAIVAAPADAQVFLLAMPCNDACRRMVDAVGETRPEPEVVPVFGGTMYIFARASRP